MDTRLQKLANKPADNEDDEERTPMMAEGVVKDLVEIDERNAGKYTVAIPQKSLKLAGVGLSLSLLLSRAARPIVSPRDHLVICCK